MCGNFIINKADMRRKAKNRALPSDVSVDHLIEGSLLPGASVSIIHQVNDAVRVNPAVWWLLLDEDSAKPNYRYASFNSRSDKLHESRALAYKPYRESRCIIPATSFVEGLGDKKHYFKIELLDEPVLFGGLFREWTDKDSGEIIYSASIITLPPVAQWQDIHPKSFPLLLPADNDGLISQWLDRSMTDTEVFKELLEPQIRVRQRITPIQGARNYAAAGESFEIEAA